MRKAIPIILIAVLLTGCASLSLKSSGVLSEDIKPSQTLRHFSRTSQALWIIGLVPLMKPDLEDIIRSEVKGAGGNGVANLSIKDEVQVLDIIISYFTGGIIGSRTVTIEGDVVKY
ncbi:MAG: hypothetical protein ACUVXI_12730 [bacterium]